MELDLDALGVGGVGARRRRSRRYPPALLDVALVVPAAVPAASVAAALRDGAGALLESLRLFDVYADPSSWARTALAGVRAAVPGRRTGR